MKNKCRYTFFYVYIFVVFLSAFTIDQITKQKADHQIFPTPLCLEPLNETAWEQKQAIAKYILSKTSMEPIEALAWAAVIYDSAQAHDVPVDYWNAIIETESGYDEKAKGRINPNDLGASQINACWNLKELKSAGYVQNKAELMTLEKNLFSRAYLFAKYIQEKDNDIYRAVQRYNGAAGSQYLFAVVENKNRFESQR